MGRRIVFDIEADGLMNVWDRVTKIHCIVAKDVDTKEIFTFGDNEETQFTLDQFKLLLGKTDEIIGHNIISYDLPAIQYLLGIDYSIADTCKAEELEEHPHWRDYDTLNGDRCFIEDTYVLSKTLFPDRDGHGIEAFGKKLGFNKIDWRAEAIKLGLIKPDDPKGAEFKKWHPRMLDYCIRDVEVNEKVYHYLKEEAKGWDWSVAYWLEKAVAELIYRQEEYGYLFDEELAKKNLEELNALMADIEARVEPLLPPRPLPVSKQPKFPASPFTADKAISATGYSWLEKLGYPVDRERLSFKEPPKTCFTQKGEVSKAGERYCNNAGIVDPEEYAPFLRECLQKAEKPVLPPDLEKKARKDLEDKVMPEMTEPMKLSSQADIKAHLVELGWKPLSFKDKDITMGQDKRKKTREKFIESCEKYIEETANSPLKPFRLEHLKVRTIAEMRDKMLSHDLSRPLKVITQPTYTVGTDKEDLCPNLVRLGDQVSYVQDIVYWLTYRHRRNAILSPNGTGLLAHPRLEYDGRLPTPADTCGCSTSRFQHKIVANIPRVTSLYGEPMRSLFCVEKDRVQIGCDADGLEARIEGHYCIPYNGEKYAESLVAAKPNDLHTINAEKMGVTRDDAKVLKYSSSYGAQPPKIAKQMNWGLNHAKKVFEAFWEASKPLSDLKVALEKHWEINDKKWILGIDGRKLWTRSKHALLNTLFQSAGVICMKRAMVYWDRWVKYEGINSKQLIAYHDESQMDQHRKEVVVKVFKTEEEAEAFKAKEESSTGKVWSDVGHVGDTYYVGYSRAGELAVHSIRKGGEFFNLRVELTSGYQMGRNWAQCH
jgi:hypothetical protein